MLALNDSYIEFSSPLTLGEPQALYPWRSGGLCGGAVAGGAGAGGKPFVDLP